MRGKRRRREYVPESLVKRYIEPRLKEMLKKNPDALKVEAWEYIEKMLERKVIKRRKK